ncbi:AlpA family transcriptional regulator [Limnohabitans sp. T6-5]|jgi:prophage regulatory protein|uniref:helix-turn-helix transcriptional regulator n=1 Tax=Limnohabitans sp. T6-5 TaxID=1100724 RepID=UPI000D37CC21|nr:AlpA family phage regulatory protein [Limnohabitans sp. T6-5]
MNPKQQPKGIDQIETLRPAVLDIDQCAAYLTLSNGTIERLVRKGEFPAPRQLSGRRVGYLLREVDEWLESRPVSDLPPPVNCEFGRAGNPDNAKPLASD